MLIDYGYPVFELFIYLSIFQLDGISGAASFIEDKAAEACFTIWDEAGNVISMGSTTNPAMVLQLDGKVCYEN